MFSYISLEERVPQTHPLRKLRAAVVAAHMKERRTVKRITRWTATAALLVVASTVSAATEYEIEVSHDDELFIINGEKYEAKTYCFNMEEGDRVIFLEGSPYGACASAKLLNLRTKKICEVWCE